MTLWWTTALLTGLAGSLHCVGMCGPLAMALPVGRFPRGQRSLVRGLYHLGRLSAYSLLGAVVGSIGQGIRVLGWQGTVSVGAGVLLLGWVTSARFLPSQLPAFGPARWLMAPLANLLRQPKLPYMAGLGFLNGLLPCGSVYVALLGATTTASPLAGATYLLLFGTGTLPALLSTQWVFSRLSPFIRLQLGRSLPWITVAVALLLIMRGLKTPEWQPNPTGSTAIPVCHGGR